MKLRRLTPQSRARLSQRLETIGSPAHYAQPVRGWVKAIREALGMTTAQLAKRLGVKQPSIVAMEQSEARGSIELATLRRAAEALDCTLVYALIPNKPLDRIVRDRARQYLKQRIDPIEHSMLLEDQSAAPADLEARIDEVLRETNPRRLWD
jgi:predicted DNA-binding mobile mystery protein A